MIVMIHVGFTNVCSVRTLIGENDVAYMTNVSARVLLGSGIVVTHLLCSSSNKCLHYIFLIY